ncbi:MAG TPA: MIP/aquaporin family protein [Burkholderiales bacterium]|nr:MIP/aquaporin family protein [Burkholderiales bacterium]
MTLAQRLTSEALGTALLLAIIIGSGIMGERLAGGSVAIALLANSIATGAGLIALIAAFGAIFDAHFNPMVTTATAFLRYLSWREAGLYMIFQCVGAFAGVACAHWMFGEPTFFASHHARSGAAQWWSEFVATFGLLSVIIGCVRGRPQAVPYAVGCYIAAAYWFTGSTSFANPAVTLARMASDTFAGIRPADALPFIVAQVAGGLAATGVMGWLTTPPGRKNY